MLVVSCGRHLARYLTFIDLVYPVAYVMGAFVSISTEKKMKLEEFSLNDVIFLIVFKLQEPPKAKQSVKKAHTLSTNQTTCSPSLTDMLNILSPLTRL